MAEFSNRICISVTGATPELLASKIRDATRDSRLVEIRFDGLAPEYLDVNSVDFIDVRAILEKFPETDFVVTLRPASEGGFSKLSTEQRNAFWNQEFECEYADFETDISPMEYACRPRKRIVSIHDFNGNTRVEEHIEAFAGHQFDIAKLAITCRDASDAVRLWDYTREPEFNSRMIPIGMGEATVWTRILSPVADVPFTYASSGTDAETAPGQLTARELREMFNFETLGSATTVFGLIGNPVGHSKSPLIHNANFAARGMDSVYVPFKVTDIGRFMNEFVRPNADDAFFRFGGFSVTAPHKESVIEHLDFLDSTAERAGAVNTLGFFGEHLVGFNTDVHGFLSPIRQLETLPQNVLILGAGGAARGCAFALRENAIEFAISSRTSTNAIRIADDFGGDVVDWDERGARAADFSAIVNATPIGTKGELEDMTSIESQFIKPFHTAYDLVYNPIKTRFLREAEENGAGIISGIDMFCAQAAKQFEIWTGETIDPDNFRETLPM